MLPPAFSMLNIFQFFLKKQPEATRSSPFRTVRARVCRRTELKATTRRRQCWICACLPFAVRPLPSAHPPYFHTTANSSHTAIATTPSPIPIPRRSRRRRRRWKPKRRADACRCCFYCCCCCCCCYCALVAVFFRLLQLLLVN